jgi:hypothetical protein
MKTNEARILLQKYLEADTSLEEEKLLSAYFRRNDLPEEMKPYIKWFEGIDELTTSEDPDSFEKNVMNTILEQEMKHVRQRRTLTMTLSGIAASLIIVAGSLIYYFQQPAYPDTFSDPAKAVAYAEKTLTFVSAEYNKGMAQLAPVHRLKSSTQSVGKSMQTIRKGFNEINKIQLVNKFKAEK